MNGLVALVLLSKQFVSIFRFALSTNIHSFICCYKSQTKKGLKFGEKISTFLVYDRPHLFIVFCFKNTGFDLFLGLFKYSEKI